MACSRPTSMVIPSGVFDESSSNESKNLFQRKQSQSIRSTNQTTPPGNYTNHAHSSSSSIDSAGARKGILTERNTLPQMTTISSTTTDSELDSEREERCIDENNSFESTQPSVRLEKQKLSRRDSGSQKTDVNTQGQSSRRKKHFQKLFKSELVDDMPELIDSYVCAYQGDILLQGKMYITDRYLCFHSRIISYVTKHVYRWEQIENVTKERVAFIFPTAIGIQIKPSGKKITYASFLQRDHAFDKILSICSRFSTETGSLQDEEEINCIDGGTLRPRNRNQRNPSDHDDVLQMCLTQEKTSSTKREPLINSSKTMDEIQQHSKKPITSEKNKPFFGNSNHEQILSNTCTEHTLGNNESNRNSRQTKQTDAKLVNSSVVCRQTYDNPRRTDQSHSRDRTHSPKMHTLSNFNSSSDLLTNNDRTIIITNNNNNDGFLKRSVRITILSVLSIIKLLMEYLSILYKQLKLYPIKTSFILVICISLLVIHSFYLIKLAYRIEDRLQSLHHKWSSASSMKTSLPPLKEL